MKIRREKDFLLKFVETLQSKGCYWFVSKDIAESLTIKKMALAKAISRLIQKGKVIRLYCGFHIIVPAEYKKAGILPPIWFIDPLMQYMDLKNTYYVGLLSAAALYGAAHQKVQEFQVIVSKVIRPIVCDKLQIKFIKKKRLQKTAIAKLKTDTGYMNVSTPEGTALDLILYMGVCGSLGNVATVLSELSEKLDSERLRHAAVEGEYNDAVIQRLGYILDFLGEGRLVQGLLDLVKKSRPKYVRLRSDLKNGLLQRNARWRIIENDFIEVDI